MRTKEELFSIFENEYPRVYKSISLFWGEKEFTPYINNLIEDKRGDRQGFSFNTFNYLIELQQIHDAEFPHHAKNDKDFWI